MWHFIEWIAVTPEKKIHMVQCYIIIILFTDSDTCLQIKHIWIWGVIELWKVITLDTDNSLCQYSIQLKQTRPVFHFNIGFYLASSTLVFHFNVGFSLASSISVFHFNIGYNIGSEGIFPLNYLKICVFIFWFLPPLDTFCSVYKFNSKYKLFELWDKSQLQSQYQMSFFVWK